MVTQPQSHDLTFCKMETNGTLCGRLKFSKAKQNCAVKKYRAKVVTVVNDAFILALKPFNFVSALFEVPLKAALFHFFGNFYVHLFISSGAF